MKKIYKEKNIKIIIITILLLIISSSIISARTSLQSSKSKQTLQNFIKSINNGDNEVYNYIDATNEELYNNVEKYLDELEIKYEITDVIEEEDSCKINAKIQASGIGWNVSGITVKFNIEEIGNQYKIVDTNLFEFIGSENIFKMVFKVFAIIGGVFLVFGVIIAIIIVTIVVKNTKKKKSNS